MCTYVYIYLFIISQQLLFEKFRYCLFCSGQNVISIRAKSHWVQKDDKYALLNITKYFKFFAINSLFSWIYASENVVFLFTLITINYILFLSRNTHTDIMLRSCQNSKSYDFFISNKNNPEVIHIEQNLVEIFFYISRSGSCSFKICVATEKNIFRQQLVWQWRVFSKR